jgi:hypothetical protein
LHDCDPNRTVETLQQVIKISDRPSWELLRAYDPQAAVRRLTSELSHRSYLHRKHEVALLEMMGSPETDALLLEDLEKYIQQEFKGWSIQLMSGSSWCKDVRPVIAAIGRRRVVSALASLVAIAARNEPENVKLSCLSAVANIGREGSLMQDPHFDQAVASLETVSQKDGSDKVRKSAARVVKALKKPAKSV